MARSDYAQALKNWQTRAQQARAAGIKDAVWQPLAKQDLQNVWDGHTPLDNAVVNDAIRAATQNSPVTNPKPSTDNPLDILGNIGGDVRDIVTGFIPGAVNYVATLPQQLSDLKNLAEQDPATQQKYGMQTSFSGPGDFIAGLLQNAAKVPVLSPLIPGLHTAAGLTSSSGRQGLEQKPVSTLLDVLPLATKAGVAATAGTEAEAGTVTESLQQGKPIRAAVRGTSDVLAKIPKVGPTFDRVRIAQTLTDAGIGTDPTTGLSIGEDLSRPYYDIQDQGVRDMAHFAQTDLYQLIAGMPDAERAALHEYASKGDVASWDKLPTNIQTALAHTRYLTDEMAQQGVEKGDLVKVPGPNGKLEVYSAKDKVAELYGKSEKVRTKLQTALNKHHNEEQVRKARESRLSAGHGKIKKYGEQQAVFDKREPGPVTPSVIRDAAVPLVEAFRDKDPMLTFGQGVMATDAAGNLLVPKSALRVVLTDMKTLSGEDGLFAKWDTAMQAGDFKTARTTLTQIRRTFRHTSWDQTPYASTLRAHVDDLTKSMVGLQKKMRSLGYNMKTLNSAYNRETKALANVGRWKQISGNLENDFQKELVNSPPARFHPVLQQKVREGANEVAQHLVTGETLQAALKGISESQSWTELAQYIPKEEVDRLYKDALQSWTQLARDGVDPIFLHNVNPGRLNYIMTPTVLPDTYYSPGVAKERVFNMSDSMHDVLAAITDQKRQILSQEATRVFVEDHLSKWVQKEVDLQKSFRDAMRDTPTRDIHTIEAQATAEMQRHWVKFDPNTHGLTQYFPSAKGESLMIPKGVDRAIKLMFDDSGIPLKGLWNNTMHLWKFSVLTTPRHLAHVALGGLMMGELREPLMFTHLREASKIVKGDNADFLSRLSANVNDVDTAAHFAFNYAAGKTIGRVFAEAVGDKVRAYEALQQHIASTYKVAAMLTEEAKGVTRDEAIREANKIFVDMHGMTPFERTTLRKIFPFYGFTRHLFRYLFTYPVDHPLRAAILTNFANQEQTDWNSGLPQSFQFLFFLGHPDANGNVTGIDYRSIDPFRSFYNDFTLAGVTSQLNPAFQIVGEQAGINMLTATPELYPGSHFDPYSGKMVADRPSNPAASIIESLVPQTQAIDAYLGLTDRYRNLARTDPTALLRTLYSTTGMPFGPETVNLNLETEQTQMRRYKDASAAISAAIQSGDFGKAKKYEYVPIPSLMKPYFPGYLYATPGDIERVYKGVAAQAASAGYGGISVHAYLSKPNISRSS